MAVVWRHGRRHAAAGARAGAAELDRLRHERPGGGRGTAIPAYGERARARIGDFSGGALRPRHARPSDRQRCRRLRRIPGHPDRSPNRRDDGRFRSKKRRTRHRVVTRAERLLRSPTCAATVRGSSESVADACPDTVARRRSVRSQARSASRRIVSSKLRQASGSAEARRHFMAPVGRRILTSPADRHVTRAVGSFPRHAGPMGDGPPRCHRAGRPRLDIPATDEIHLEADPGRRE